MNLRGQIILFLCACGGAENWVLLGAVSRQLRCVSLDALHAEIEAMELDGLLYTKTQITKIRGEARSRSELILKLTEQTND